MYSRRIKVLITSLSISLTVHLSLAQSASNSNAATLKLKIQKLNTLGSVLYFAAHPDDENTRLIAWLANEKLYRTGYLSLTRGDGGQNLIGTEQAEELGLVRTQELLAARRDDGGEQFFSTANDFGFSKTFAETFKIWNKEKILADAVWVIRNFQPDVIITRFPGDPRAGHGHHQASSLIAQEAFKAAADPNKFPEQLKYVKTWQAKRILWNTYNFGSANTIEDGQFSLDIGQFNPLLGRTYGEIAAISRTNHKSQGFGSTPQRGEMNEYFETLAGDTPKSSIFDNIETGWSRVPNAQPVQALIQKINNSFNMEHPEYAVKDLVQLLTALEKLGNSYWPVQKAKEVKELILACAGIWAENQASTQKYALGETVDISTNIVLQTQNISASLVSLTANSNSKASETPLTLEYNKLERIKSSFVAHTLTQPYWLAKPHNLGSFSVSNQQLIGMPEADDLPSVTATFNIEGKNIAYQLPIIYSFNDPVRGEIKNPLIIAPPITVNLHQKAIIFNGEESKKMEISFISNAEQTHAVITPLLPKGWRTEPASFEVNLDHRNDEETKNIIIYPAEKASANDSISFNISYNNNEKGIARSIQTISHQHIPQITWFPLSSAKLSKVETGVSSKRIGYISGAGDLVPQSLREIGLIVDVLSENDVTHNDLSVYDAIVTGIRIYNVNDRMRFMQTKLLNYVKNGGTLVEQYNVSGGLKTNQIGPYPFSISRDRVTDEKAKVSIVEPQHTILNFPNKITGQDFDGWIQERGLYFASDIDKQYSMPLEMNDPGETANRGSLLVTKYGKGKYVYTSLAFFRELPAGVPGAYRLFVNLLAKEKN